MPGAGQAHMLTAGRCTHTAPAWLQAVLKAMTSSLGALRKRLGGTQGGGVFFLERPFFNVSLQLAVPHVICSPSLGDIQAAINAATKKVHPGRVKGLGFRV